MPCVPNQPTNELTKAWERPHVKGGTAVGFLYLPCEGVRLRKPRLGRSTSQAEETSYGRAACQFISGRIGAGS